MSTGFPSRRGLAVAFLAGAAAAFTWALLRPHPPSPYREALERVRAERGLDRNLRPRTDQL